MEFKSVDLAKNKLDPQAKAAKASSQNAQGADSSIFLSNTCKKDKPCIAIIDNFKEPMIDLNGDNKADIAHGEAVKDYVQTQIPEAGFVLYDTSNSKSSSVEDMTGSKINSALKDIAKRAGKGQKPDAVNLSIAQLSPLPKDIRKDLDKLKVLFSNEKDTRRATIGDEDADIVDSIEKVTEKGVPVYVAGGNGGPTQVNMLGLAKGTINVGSQAKWSAKNPLVNAQEQGIFKIKEFKKDNNTTCYDFTEDNKIDKCVKTPSGFDSSLERPKELMGTSFATPTLLGKQIAQKYKNM